MEPTKRRKMFRNPWPEKKFYLRSRDPERPQEDYILNPGATVEALDEAEEKLLASMSLIDIEKETPAIANATEKLQQELAAEKAKNAALLADKEALEAQVEKSNRRVDARHGKR